MGKGIRLLFVHGMGRSPVSGWPLIWQLKWAGLSTSTFGYSTALETFPGIRGRLVARLSSLAAHGDYAVVGHSLGGVLLRAAINGLPPGVRRPRYLFLLGSPVHPARLAKRLRANRLYRLMTGDCGQLLGSGSRMAAIGPVGLPTLAVVGVRGLSWKAGPFSGELNDGVVALSEVSAPWLDDRIEVDVVHTLLPSSKRVGDIILTALGRSGESPAPG